MKTGDFFYVILNNKQTDKTLSRIYGVDQQALGFFYKFCQHFFAFDSVSLSANFPAALPHFVFLSNIKLFLHWLQLQVEIRDVWHFRGTQLKLGFAVRVSIAMFWKLVWLFFSSYFFLCYFQLFVTQPYKHLCQFKFRHPTIGNYGINTKINLYPPLKDLSRGDALCSFYRYFVRMLFVV